MSPMTYSGASCNNNARPRRWSSWPSRWRAIASTSSVCWATEKMCAPLDWPFQRATRASPCAMSSISISSGEGSSRSSRRPDSIRCHARRLCVAPVLFADFLNGLMAVASNEMVVDHADGLHEGVDDGRPAELEAAPRQFLGHGARCRGFRRHLACGAEMIDLRPPIDEIPQQFRKTGEIG